MNLKKKKTVLPLNGWPAWFDGKSINEALFCQHFNMSHASLNVLMIKLLIKGKGLIKIVY